MYVGAEIVFRSYGGLRSLRPFGGLHLDLLGVHDVLRTDVGRERRRLVVDQQVLAVGGNASGLEHLLHAGAGGLDFHGLGGRLTFRRNDRDFHLDLLSLVLPTLLDGHCCLLLSVLLVD